MNDARERTIICQHLGVALSTPLPELAAKIAIVADSAQRAALSNLLTALVAVETQPFGGFRQP